jgi:Raf kinase inhibitor-like YbhB/YbcL family protein
VPITAHIVHVPGPACQELQCESSVRKDGIPQRGHDLDAATGNPMGGDITHWVVWNIPGTATKLPENVPAGATLMDGSHQANNIANAPKYQGPSSSAGAPYHHYIFQLYALNAMLDLPATATRSDVEKALDGKIVARSAYTGKVKG